MKKIYTYTTKYWQNLPLWLKCGMLAGVLKVTITIIQNLA